jgi:hypothetical protein
MRTKALLTLAAVAAGAMTSMAQSNVYSLNVVGYVNTTFPAGALVCVAPPLDAGTNDLNTLIPTAPASSQVLTWNVGLQDYDGTVPTYNTKKASWNPDLTIPTGSGFFVTMQANWTNTWVGNVRQGALSIPIDGNGALDLIGSLVPIGGSLTNVLAGYAGTPSDQILTWNVSLGDFDGTVPSYNTKKGVFAPDVDIAVGSGFFLNRRGTPIVYTRNFTVQ